MNTKNQKRLAGQVINCSPHRVRFDESRLSDIKEAITKTDVRGLVREGVIKEVPMQGISHGRLRKKAVRRRRGQGKGPGKRKGMWSARSPRKERWINKVRSQRGLLSQLRERGTIDNTAYRNLYLKVKGGFFRNKRHIKLYIEENGLVKK